MMWKIIDSDVDRTDRGLQSETAEGLVFAYHRWDAGGEGQLLHIPGCVNLPTSRSWWKRLVSVSTTLDGRDAVRLPGTSTPALWRVSSPGARSHGLGRLQAGREDHQESGSLSRTDHQNHPSRPTGHLLGEMWSQGSQNDPGQISPKPQSVLPAAFRNTLLLFEGPQNEELLSSSPHPRADYVYIYQVSCLNGFILGVAQKSMSLLHNNAFKVCD